MAFNQADWDFRDLCNNGKFNEAEKLLQKGEVSSEQVYKQALWYLEENAAFASSCLKYLQKERPDDSYTKALQGILYVKDKKYKEALELFESKAISLDAFKHILDIVKERKDKASQSFLVNCLDYIDFSSLEENESLPLSMSDIKYLLKLAQQHNKKDFIKSCLASKNRYLDKSDVLFTLKEDKNFSTYLSEALSQGLSIDDMERYINEILYKYNRISSEKKEKYLKEFFSVLGEKAPDKFPSVFVKCFKEAETKDDAKMLANSISSDQLIEAVAHAAKVYSRELAGNMVQYLTKEKQLQVLSEITGIPLQQGKKKRGKKSSQNKELENILTQLSLGKDENDTVHFCECISELKTFKEKERQFFIAVLRGQEKEAIELFNPKEIDINKTLGGKTALMYAIDNGCNKLVEFLLAQEGLNPLIMDRNERIAHDYERAKKLEEENKQTLETLTEEGKNHANLLFAAVEEHNVEEVVRLLKNGAANVNIKDQEGEPLIVRALELGMAQEDLKIVQALIEAGVDLNLEGPKRISGYSFLDANVEKIASLKEGIAFLKSIPNYSPLIPLLTQERYNADLIKNMVEGGVDINTVCARTNKTALETAVENKLDLSKIQDLLDLHPKDEKGAIIVTHPASVLYQVVESGQEELLLSLLTRGMDIDAVDENGDTALKKAIEYSRRSRDPFDDKAIKLIRIGGANLYHPSIKKEDWERGRNHELTEYARASYCRNKDDIKAVLRYGNPELLRAWAKKHDINKKYAERFYDGAGNLIEHEGYTPLMWAIEYGRADMVKAILELKPDLSVVSDSGMTALDIAKRNNNPYIYRLLNDYAQKNEETQGVRGVVSQESENLQELLLAIRECNLDRVKALTAQMPDLNIQDSQGNSPAKLTAELLAAMAVGESEDYTIENMKDLGAILLHLQSKGAKMVYSSDDSPIMILCQNLQNTRPCKTEQDAKKLLEYEGIISNLMAGHKGDLNCHDSKGNTPLHYAVMGSAPVVVTTILNQKVTWRPDGNGFIATNEYHSADIKNNAGLTARDLWADLFHNRKYPYGTDGMDLAYSAMNAINRHPRKGGPDYGVCGRSYNQTPEIRVVSYKPYERIKKEAAGDRDFEYVFKNEDKNQINHPTNQVFELLSELVSIRKGQEPQQASTTFDLRLIDAMEDEETTAETLQELIDEVSEVNADVNAVVNAADGEGNTPLHQAVMYGEPEFVDVLIANKAEVNKTNAVGLTPLDLVIQNLNKQAALNEEERDAEYVEALKEIAKRLRAAGGKAKQEISKTALNIEGVREIFGDTYQFKDEKQIKKEIVALFRGDSSINIRAVNPKDKKPMIIKVIETGDMDLIKNILTAYRVTAEALLERGPDGRNAIDIAFASENEKLKKWMDDKLKDAGVVLLDYKDTYAALESGYEGTLSFVKNTLEKGKILDLRVTDKEGKTILHHLAEQGHMDLLEQALSQWVYSNNLSVLTITDKSGDTPLYLIPQDKKKHFVLKYLKEELDKKDKNDKVITELLEQLDEKTLEELKVNEEYQLVHNLIQDQLAGISQERAKVSALNQQGTNAIAALNDNAERNITTARGTDGVDISYTSSRGRA